MQGKAKDVVHSITKNILKLMKEQGSQWTKPWANKLFTSVDGYKYTGGNIMQLAFEPYDRYVWGTYKQWTKHGCQVKKGESSTKLLFIKKYIKEVEKKGETKEQMFEAEGKLPDTLVACIGGGSHAIGLFHPFLDDDVEIIGVEAAGLGISTKQHAASLTGGRPGVLHGNRTYLLQDNDGQITEAHSISAGLDYPGIGPEHSWLFETGRIEYVSATDNEALEAFALCSKLEGIIPALEPSHALAYITNIISPLPKDHFILMNRWGRGE